jgi:hypothetical protein
VIDQPANEQPVCSALRQRPRRGVGLDQKMGFRGRQVFEGIIQVTANKIVDT